MTVYQEQRTATTVDHRSTPIVLPFACHELNSEEKAVVAKICQQATSDPAFNQRCLQNPASIIKEIDPTGKLFTKHKIVFIENGIIPIHISPNRENAKRTYATWEERAVKSKTLQGARQLSLHLTPNEFEAIAALTKRIYEDESFRNACLANLQSTNAIAKDLLTIPDYQLIFVQDSDVLIHLLTLEQISHVVGGSWEGIGIVWGDPNVINTGAPGEHTSGFDGGPVDI